MASPELILLDVGHGNSSVIIAGKLAIVDCPKTTVLQDLLAERAITEIDAIFVSHADADHIRGLTGLIQDPAITVQRVYVNPDTAKATDAWDDFRSALRAARESSGAGLPKVSGVSADEPGSIDLGMYVSMSVLAPTGIDTLFPAGGLNAAKQKVTSNDSSVVIRISHKDAGVALLAGDLTEKGMEALQGATPTAPILVFPHHGGLPGGGADPKKFAARLLELVQPDLVFFSNGRSMTTPRLEILEAISQAQKSCMIACAQLSKQCSEAAGTEDLAHVYVHSAGRISGTSCAGSLVVSLGDTLDNLGLAEHKAFVDKSVKAPACRLHSKGAGFH